MAIVNQRQKWIYLMEPHTASRAVANALMAQGGCGQLGHHHIGVSELTDRRRTQLIQNISEYDIICTVRNPLDVLVTKWKYGPKDQAFCEWVMERVDKGHESVTNPMMGLWRDCNKFVYYEHLEDDLEHVFGKGLNLGFDPTHVTKDKEPWQNYYADPDCGCGEELLDLLMPLYEGFMTQFGYELFVSDQVYAPKCFMDNEIRDQRCQSL